MTVTVDAVNDAPVAADDTCHGGRGHAATIGARTCSPTTPTPDTGETLTVDGGDAAGANGTVTLNGDGSVTYTPNANFNGTDSFTYTVARRQRRHGRRRRSRSRSPAVNDAPIAVNDAATARGRQRGHAVDVLANDTDAPDAGDDADGDAWSTQRRERHGDARRRTARSPTRRTPNFTGDRQLHLHGRATATAALEHRDGDDHGHRRSTTRRSRSTTRRRRRKTRRSAGTCWPTTRDADAGTTLTATLVASPANGVGHAGRERRLHLHAERELQRADSFTYTASDGTATSKPRRSRSPSTPVNDAPVAAADSYATAEDTPLTIAAPGVLGNDTDVDERVADGSRGVRAGQRHA